MQSNQQHTTTSELATLAESSNLLLGITRPLSKLAREAEPLPQTSPIPSRVSGFGSETRLKRYVSMSDSGYADSSKRFYSEYYHLPAPICDTRPTEEMFGAPSRLNGRAPIMRAASR